VETLGLDRVLSLVREGVIQDGKTLIGLGMLGLLKGTRPKVHGARKR
jgi:hypothetical protein